MVVGLPHATVVVMRGGHEVPLDGRVELDVAGAQSVHADHMAEILDGSGAYTHLGQRPDDHEHPEEHQGEGDEAPVEARDLPDQGETDNAGRHQHEEGCDSTQDLTL